MLPADPAQSRVSVRWHGPIQHREGTDMNRSRSASLFGSSLLRGSALALASLALLVPASMAQTPVSDAAHASHPAHIHSGSCAELGEVVYPLTDVALPAGEMMGADGGHPVESSDTNLPDVSLQDILGGQYAVNVHLSADEIGTYIACGNIGGVVDARENGDGQEISVGLAELNDSGYVGVAWLGDDGNGGTNVGLTLINLDEMGGHDMSSMATPAA
jgi:hypothetical protein